MGLDYKDYKLFTNFFRAISDSNQAVQGSSGTACVHLIVSGLAVQKHHAGYDLNLLLAGSHVCCHQKTWKHLASLAQTTKTMKICQTFFHQNDQLLGEGCCCQQKSWTLITMQLFSAFLCQRD